MNYRALYDDDPKSGNDAADLAYLQGLKNRTQKSPNEARVSERTVYKIFGPTVIVENVSNLRAIGLESVLADLAALGFNAEWHSIPAAAVGAPQRRDRVWIIANSIGVGRLERQVLDEGLLSQHGAWASGSHHPFDEMLGSRYFGIPPYLRVGDGLRPGLDEVAQRLKALGNAIVPQIAEVIGTVITKTEAAIEEC